VAVTSSRTSLVSNWRTVLRTGNPPEGALDPVSKWLVLTRAAVIPMTLTAAAIAGLLAARDGGVRPGLFALAAVGLVLAHMSNNLMNDLFDLDVGNDTENYPRALYAPHPVLSGLISRAGLARAALFVNVIDLVILGVLFRARGWPVVAFALAGFLVSVAYTAPPLRLKKHGLGEPSVLLVWGPLMVGGTYYAATGRIGWDIVAASIPYSLLCTAVLMGKHIDKAAWDGPTNTRTLPVMLGDERGRAFTKLLMAAFYPLVVVLVVLGWLPWPALISVLAIPQLAKVWPQFNRPAPAAPPPKWPIWPLWFAPLAFVHTRRAGALFVLGLAIGALI
jgi:1,4-dihydroxy-2-naphthoate octaprenyltransferase